MVKGEVLDVNLARGLINGGRFPLDSPIVVQDRLGHDGDLIVAVGTVVPRIIRRMLRCEAEGLWLTATEQFPWA